METISNVIPANPNAWRGFLMGLAAFLLYSSSDVCVKMLSEHFTVLQIMGLQNLIALPFMLAFVCWRGGKGSLRHHHFHHHVIRGILFLLQGAAAYYGFQHLPMANTYTFIFVMPVFTLIFAVLFLRERVNVLQSGLIALAFVGVLVVFRPGLDSLNMAAVVVLLGSMIGGLSQVMMRYMAARESFGASLIYPVAVSTGICLLLSLLDWRWPNTNEWGIFALSGVIVAAAHILIVSAFFSAPASQVAPTQYSQIIWGTLFGYFFFADIPDQFVFMGAGLIIFAGVWLAKIEYEKSRLVMDGGQHG